MELLEPPGTPNGLLERAPGALSTLLMQFDQSTINQLNDLRILDVADRLGLHYSGQGAWRKARCFVHDDHHPSLGISPSSNRWKCFSCGEGGNHIELVMKHEHLDFPAACEWLCRAFHIPIPQRAIRQSLVPMIQSKSMNASALGPSPTYLDASIWERFPGISNELTRALVNNRILSSEQMAHAAEVYRLSTLDDHVIFWQIDREQRICDGKMMHYQADAHRSQTRAPCTISWLLKQAHQLPDTWKAQRCLFGLHQLSEANERTITIVESEKTAIICSELLADENCIWLATGGSSNLSLPMLQPLQGRKIIIFPDTDPTGATYREWLRIAQEASKHFGHPFTVSDLLERHASTEQKQRKIDIADWVVEER